MVRPRVDIVGQVFGRLTARRYLGGGRWVCDCCCGCQTIVMLCDLRRATRSCGCLRRELAKTRSLQLSTHGMSKTPEYRVWERMLARCCKSADPAYRNYGGRGISVCVRWQNFVNFIHDIGLRPSASHTLERLDNDGNYEPGNCVWATRRSQARNRRTNRMLTFRGMTKCLAEWSSETGIGRQVIYDRLRSGWSVQDALTVPTAKRMKNVRGD